MAKKKAPIRDRWAEAKALKAPQKLASLYAEGELTLSELKALIGKKA